MPDKPHTGAEVGHMNMHDCTRPGCVYSRGKPGPTKM